MNAIEDNAWSRAWRSLGASLTRPRAVVCVSAHWYLPGTCVTAMARPRTIHDFGGFPRALYDVAYPAPGDPALARDLAERLAPLEVALDEGWGLDHGAWSILRRLFPDADVPVVQLSIDETRPAAFHYDVGRRLAPLRDQGVLLLGSGNVVHNLHAYAWGRHSVEPFDWAVRFEQSLRADLLAREHARVVDFEGRGRDARLAAPTPEHFLPLLYVIGAQRDGDAVTFPVEGVDGGSVSMLSVRVG
jgi:4,5-DOPA dioxygenase extradiol